MVEYVVFQSRAVHPEGDLSNLSILRKSLSKNSRLGVTGFLYREKGRFYQYLEGRSENLITLYATIAQDRRHIAMARLEDGTRETRLFSNWSMGYAASSAGDDLHQFLSGHGVASGDLHKNSGATGLLIDYLVWMSQLQDAKLATA